MALGLHGVHFQPVQKFAIKMVVLDRHVIVNATCHHQCLEEKIVLEMQLKQLLVVLTFVQLMEDLENGQNSRNVRKRAGPGLCIVNDIAITLNLVEMEQEIALEHLPKQNIANLQHV